MKKRGLKIFSIGVGIGIVSIGLLLMIHGFIKGKTIPDYIDVESVKVVISGGDNAFSELEIKEKPNIVAMTKIHKELDKYTDKKIETWKSDVGISYIMEDGTNLDFDIKGIRDIEGYFEPIMNSDEYKKSQYPIFTMDESKINKIVVTDSYVDRDVSVEIFDQPTIDQLITLARQSALDNRIGMEGLLIAELEFYNNDDELAQTYCLRENKEFLAFIQNHKQLSMIPVSLDEIAYILIEDEESDELITIKDDQRISLILDKYYNGYSSMYSSYGVEFVMMDQESRHWYGSFYKGNEPEDIDVWFEEGK